MVMEDLMSMPNLLNFIDYTSTDCIERLLRHYYDIEHLAFKGYPAVLDLYLELKGALDKLELSESQAILDAVGLQDVTSIEQGAKKIQAILLIG
jgi:hypothetical protein